MVSYQPEMIGLEWLTVHPEDREKNDSCLPTDVTSGKVEVEARARRKDGSVFDQQAVMIKAATAAIYWALLLYQDSDRRERTAQR